jgi:ribosomal protein S18 acetylase RimI-like enzyme
VVSSWIISAARPEERDAALRVAFAHVPGDERLGRIAQIHDLIALGEIDPQGLFVCRYGGQIRGVFACLPMAGGTALVWAPRGEALAAQSGAGDALIEAGLAWLRDRGNKIAQVIVPPEEADAIAPLARHGFRPAGPMRFFERDLAPLPLAPTATPVRSIPLPQTDVALFAQTLERTYHGTLDFPELSNLRTIGQILTTYRASPHYRPEHWRLAFVDDEPVGVLMLSELEPLEGWDLTYLGVVPEWRRRSVGQALVAEALQMVAHAAGARLDVAVDARNLPAVQLYNRLGFQLVGERLLSLVFLTSTA